MHGVEFARMIVTGAIDVACPRLEFLIAIHFCLHQYASYIARLTLAESGVHRLPKMPSLMAIPALSCSFGVLVHSCGALAQTGLSFVTSGGQYGILTGVAYPTTKEFSHS